MPGRQKGFTLIELLVVVSIIGVLSTIAMTSLNGARAKARDARRKTDLYNLSQAVQSHFYLNGGYPDDASSYPSDWPANYKSQLALYMPNLPIDPTPSGGRYYGSMRMTWAPDAKCNGHYVLWTYLEAPSASDEDCGFGSPHFFIVLDEY